MTTVARLLSPFPLVAVLSGSALVALQTTTVHRATLTAEQAAILSHMSIVHLDDGQGGTTEAIRISGVNVQIVNGLGATETTNGVGNLIVGYNELGNEIHEERSGSHSLVMGTRNSYSSYGGLVTGTQNWSGGAHASVISGENARATGTRSAILAGNNCIAENLNAVVISGSGNRASGEASLVAGGTVSEASGRYSVVVGGANNLASGLESTVSGGAQNDASGRYATISGAGTSIASGDLASVHGGEDQHAGGNVSTILGGTGSVTTHFHSTVTGCGNVSTGNCSQNP